ncbi:hypothetical protein NC796_05530 [Aliifodinibius sp. S!AR15-10]|uniref:hypothetical protein n=1 Tax=Aliifodinibius sp. S!AR15-10 TaxID=2950437 RepID=UPI00285D4F1D|nr:hypothetical protein [Aliifodinibius sp. S!AR15-10]MDR8390589.1 hypothetical protein [Aliifodinibius sp. S!AR15-10]
MKLRIFQRLLFISFFCYAALVSTHKGEFWPFTIYPMFSQAGQPWSRGVVVHIDDKNNPQIWQVKPLDEVKDNVVSLADHNIDDIDYANYISKTRDWNQERIQGLRDVFGIGERPGEQWMATRVTGRMTESDSVVIKAIPMFLFTADTTYKNPNLFKEEQNLSQIK